MRTWEETKNDIIKHLENHLPEGTMERVSKTPYGETIIDSVVSYVRQIEVREEYKRQALKAKHDQIKSCHR